MAKWKTFNVRKSFPAYCGHRTRMRGGMVASSELVETVPPSDEDSRLAMETCKQLEPFIRAHRESQTHIFSIQICHDDSTMTSMIPGVVLPILFDVLTQIAQGTSVVVNHLPSTLTIEQAADFLNVSTPYIESLISHNDIPIRVVGNHRQILREDLVSYKKQSDARRQAVLDELSALGQEIGEGL
jgi:excisionase family DNA binding protein